MTSKRKTLFVAILVCVLLGIAAYYIFGKKDLPEGSLPESTVKTDSTDELWYKHSIIYTLDVKVFKDSDGDGIGDFDGLTSRLGYIDSLGANVIWLAPFQPSTQLDDGYDMTDFYGVDSLIGTMQSFRNFIKAANARNIKVIMDLVPNHTSYKHPWFEQARKDKNSPYRNWYVWSKERPSNYDVGMVFPGVQKETWSYDTTAGEYYYHRFYFFQPDLNTQNAAVVNEVKKVMKYWIDNGLSGFRLDAVPFYIEIPQTKGEKWEHQFELLTDMHKHIQSLRKDAIVLGEANVMPEETKDFFGEDGERMQMMFNFFVNQHMFYALASGDADPLEIALQRTAEIPQGAQWGQFLRNHDEVDLGRLSKKEREEIYKKFGPDKGMQLYDRGIRRRLAPMLSNNRKQLELAYSLLFSLPSTPVMRYGDEIGMGDNLALNERLAVRTPMQWSAEKNGGFTSNTVPYRVLVDTGVFSYKSVNVAKQLADSSSMLSWTKKIIQLRKAHPEISYGEWKLINTSEPSVLVLHYKWNNKELLVAHNFSDKPVNARLDKTSTLNGTYVSTFSNDRIEYKDNSDISVRLDGYGYQWFSK